MKPGWTKVALGEVLDARTKSCAILPEQEYKEVTVRLWGRGVRLRRKVHGAEINATKRNVATTGDFILSKIDARHGAYGFIPSMLDGAVVTNDFPLFQVIEHKLNPRWLYWISKSRFFVNLCKGASKGTTNRVRLKESLFFELEIPLPPLTEQNRLTTHLDAIEQRLHQIQKLRENQKTELLACLRSSFQKLITDADWVRMATIAPVNRRPVEIDPTKSYPGLGTRSFGKGIFHKPAMSGSDLTWQKLFEVHEGDIVISNIKAWEGAIAVATEADHGRHGSHRYLTCSTDLSLAFPKFICFYLLSKSGLEKIGRASPGSADRNRTLGMKRLASITVPVTNLEAQKEFLKLLAFHDRIHSLTKQSVIEESKIISASLFDIFDK